MLNSKKLTELIRVTRQKINLTEVVIEKDYYVTQVIHALSGTENDYFRLVFSGGTCLAKAHKIVKRMSEDVDFKIQVKNTGLSFSKTRLLKELKEFRSLIKEKLMRPNLIVGDPVVRNEGQYSKIEIEYPNAFSVGSSRIGNTNNKNSPISSGLRPHILLEFTLSNVRLSIENLPIKSLIEDTLENIAISPLVETQCVSVEETAIEKWVGLTRRVVAIERGYHDDDETLIRHVYDLSAITQANKIHTDFFMLAKDIIGNDAKQFKNQHPEYSTNPVTEIKQSLELLKAKPVWQDRYQVFIENMVYEDTADFTYDKAIVALEQLSHRAIGAYLGA
jgi:predicted nucleotidyltransferase component of viral defense system